MDATWRGWRVLGGLAIALLVVLVVGAGAGAWLFLWPMRNPHPVVRFVPGSLVISGARVYVSPDAPALSDAEVVVTDGHIVFVGPAGAAPARPEGAKVLPCDGCTVAAGLWNAHVHFTEEKWRRDDSTEAWSANLAAMLTSRGFTTVVDTGSDLRVTLSLRRRIESGEMVGPYIYTAGGPLYPPHGLPYYLRGTLPPLLQHLMAQPNTPAEAASDTEANIGRGADLLKLFTGSYVERDRVLPMPVDIARAAVDVAHRHGQLVFSHASDLAGTRVALDSGVDVLAHTPDSTDGMDDEFLSQIVARRMSMVPTLKMFATTVTTKPAYIDPIHAVLRRFRVLGGEILFGTDVGYMADYATEDEYAALLDCGLTGRDILRALTLAPAKRFGVAGEGGKGTVEVGKIGDLVLFDADPVDDPSTFARPRATVRGGQVIFARTAGR